MLSKWLESRISEYLSIQGVELTDEQYEHVLSEVDLWLFENIDTVIGEVTHHIITKGDVEE